jgi:hypothetical protein
MNIYRCVISNPVENGIAKLGESKLIKGETSFFLQPGEVLEHVRIFD